MTVLKRRAAAALGAIALGVSATGCGQEVVAPSTASEQQPTSTAAVEPAAVEAEWDPGYLKGAFLISSRFVPLTNEELLEASSVAVQGEFVSLEPGVQLFEDDPGGATLFFTIQVTDVMKGDVQTGDDLTFAVLQSGAEPDMLEASLPVGTPIVLYGDKSAALTEAGRPDIVTPYNSQGLIFGAPDGTGLVKPLVHRVQPEADLTAALP